ACLAGPRDLPAFPTRRSSDLQRTERHPRVLLITTQAMHDDLFHLYDADLLHGVVAAPWTPGRLAVQAQGQLARWSETSASPPTQDRKSTRLNSSHVKISYAVF